MATTNEIGPHGLKNDFAKCAAPHRFRLTSKTTTCDGIVIGARMMGEKDKLIELFSPELGRIKVIAKSAASYKSKLRGCLDPTTFIRVQLYRGNSFHLVTEVQVLSDFPGIRLEFNRISFAAYCIDVIKKTTAFEQANLELFTILHQFLSRLDQGESHVLLRPAFHEAILLAEGLWDEDYAPSDAVFSARFGEYCGAVIPPPLLI